MVSKMDDEQMLGSVEEMTHLGIGEGLSTVPELCLV